MRKYPPQRLGKAQPPKPAFGARSFVWLWWTGALIGCIGAVLFTFYYNHVSGRNSVIRHVVSRNETVDMRWNISCVSTDYKRAQSCTPTQCARIVLDSVIPDGLVKILASLATKIMKLTPGGAGGPTIWDFHKGAISFNEHFVDIFRMAEADGVNLPLVEGDIDALETAISLIKAEIVNRFDLDEKKLFLTSPSFFARIGGGAKPKTKNDEYWHPHVDMIAYGSFTYTALIYLSNYGEDFKGGEFIWRSGPEQVVVEPRKGRLSIFTSGSENVHNVEKVTAGKRLALTVAFTCDPSKQASDFLGRAKRYVSRQS